MANFTAWFEGRRDSKFRRFIDYSRDEAIRLAKEIAGKEGYTSIYLTYMESGKTVGYWEKKGSRWYKV